VYYPIICSAKYLGRPASTAQVTIIDKYVICETFANETPILAIEPLSIVGVVVKQLVSDQSSFVG